MWNPKDASELNEYHWDICFNNDINIIRYRINPNILIAAKTLFRIERLLYSPVINLGTTMNFGNLSGECCKCSKKSNDHRTLTTGKHLQNHENTMKKY